MPKTREPATYAPVARVLPLLGLSVIDRYFDYRIDTELSDIAQPGVRVRVRFHNRLVDGILLDRVTESDFSGKLSWIDRVVSPEIVYPAPTRKLVEAIVTRYGGTTSDLIRLAIPSRHASAERADTTTAWEDLGTVGEPDLSYWSSYTHGESFVDAVLRGQTARAAWQILPGDDWAAALAALAVKVVKDGGGALIILPDQRDIDHMEQALRKLVSPKQLTILTASQGPQARYSRYLSILHGQGRLVIGNRSAAFAPITNLTLAIIKDDGDPSLVETRAPYFHAREVLTTRSAQEQCSLIIASHARTAETQLLVNAGWAHDLTAGRDTIRTRMPRIHASGDTDTALEHDRHARGSRLPSSAYQAIRAALDRDTPALVQVPRKGYVPILACQHCRIHARCRHCNGPLGIPSSENYAVPSCGWCGRQDPHYRCANCGGTGVRAVVLGHDRTAEEFGRAFPQTPIIVSGGNKIIDTIFAEPAIVIATPGAEPRTIGGHYGAAVLLDAWALLNRQDLRATEETLAKWAHATSLVASHTHQGEVVVVADPGIPIVQNLIRWDMVSAAKRELAERQDVDFPPAVHMAAVDGTVTALHHFTNQLDLPETAEILGPVDLPPGEKLPGSTAMKDQNEPIQRILIRAPLGPRNQLGMVLKAAYTAVQTLYKDDTPVRIQVDPIHIG